MKERLIDIDYKLQELYDSFIDDETGGFIDGGEEMFLQKFEQLSLDRANKIDAIVAYVKNLEYDSAIQMARKEQHDKESKAIASRIKANDGQVDFFKAYLTDSIMKNGDTLPNGKMGFQTEQSKISFRTSKSVEVENEDEWMHDANNYQYCSFTQKVNKTLLKRMIEDGNKIDGVSLVEKQNIQIK